MHGLRDPRELERRLAERCQSAPGATKAAADSKVADLLPDLSVWARGLASAPHEATALAEQTLQYTIDHMAEFVETTDVRRWLVQVMVELRLGRVPHRRR